MHWHISNSLIAISELTNSNRNAAEANIDNNCNPNLNPANYNSKTPLFSTLTQTIHDYCEPKLEVNI